MPTVAAITPAHYQQMVLNEALRLWFPEHSPREQDPHYKLFHQAKKMMRKLDVPCWRCGVHYADLVRKGAASTQRNPLAATQLEAHHQDVEFSLSNAVDVEHWFQASTAEVDGAFTHVYSDVAGFLKRHPELDPANHEDVFQTFVESEGNLQQLCDVCHRSTHQGVHHIPYPEWRSLAVWMPDMPAHIS